MDKNKLFAVVALETPLLVIPMMYPTIPIWAGYTLLAAALLLSFYALIGFLNEAGKLNFSLPMFRSQVRRISLLELRSEAKKQGWDVAGKTNLEVMDLLDGLRQALVGGLPAWGRPMRFEIPSLIKNEPISAIPVDYWKDYEIYTGEFANRSVLDNFDITTLCMHNMLRPDKARYCDVWLDRAQAMGWFSKNALAFKGRRDDFNAAKKSYA